MLPQWCRCNLEKVQERVLAGRSRQDVLHYRPRIDRCRLQPLIASAVSNCERHSEAERSAAAATVRHSVHSRAGAFERSSLWAHAILRAVPKPRATAIGIGNRQSASAIGNRHRHRHAARGIRYCCCLRCARLYEPSEHLEVDRVAQRAAQWPNCVGHHTVLDEHAKDVQRLLHLRCHREVTE
jgi:hypothetical protein